jgi:hypothetical protein
MLGMDVFVKAYKNRLAEIVHDVNRRLAEESFRGRQNYAKENGVWAAFGLAERSTPQVTSLQIAFPCYKIKSWLPWRNRRASLIRLGQPGFWRRLLKLFLPYKLFFEIKVQKDGLCAKASLKQDVGS